MASESPPKISIGMPAYNSERTIASAIDSLLAQSFKDFELIVSDNASSDSTLEIVQRFAAADPRIQLVRQAQNIGANANYTYVARCARGKYFKWASSSDWYDSTFLERCIEFLELNNDAVLAYPRTRVFQNIPSKYLEYDSDIDVCEENPEDRLMHVIRKIRLNNVMNGLIRTEYLRKTRYIERYPSADVVLVGNLALLGKLKLLPEPLYYRRMESETSTSLMSPEAIERHHYPNPTIRSLFPSWKLYIGWMRISLSATINMKQRKRVMVIVTRMAYWNWKDLINDIRMALRFVFPSRHRN